MTQHEAPVAPDQEPVPVAPRALVQRINRKLAEHNEKIRGTRAGTRAQIDLGEYYRLRYGRGGDEPSTNVIEFDVNLERLGRELGVLAPWERLDD